MSYTFVIRPELAIVFREAEPLDDVQAWLQQWPALRDAVIAASLANTEHRPPWAMAIRQLVATLQKCNARDPMSATDRASMIHVLADLQSPVDPEIIDLYDSTLPAGFEVNSRKLTIGSGGCAYHVWGESDAGTAIDVWFVSAVFLGGYPLTVSVRYWTDMDNPDSHHDECPVYHYTGPHEKDCPLGKLWATAEASEVFGAGTPPEEWQAAEAACECGGSDCDCEPQINREDELILTTENEGEDGVVTLRQFLADSLARYEA